MADGGKQFPERVVTYLTSEQRKRLERVAWRRRQPVTAVIRELVDTLK